MKLEFASPHARKRVEEYNISEEELRSVLSTPDRAYPSPYGTRRRIAEKDTGPRILRVVYNEGEEDAVVIVTAFPIRKLTPREGRP